MARMTSGGGAGPAASEAEPPLQSAAGGVEAPILFFDTAPVCGIRGTVYAFVLETVVQDVAGDAASNHRRVVAHLRTTAEGLRSLKDAIARIELMTARPAGGTN